MGGKEYAHVDSSYFTNVSFHLNILVCGDYLEDRMEKDLQNIKKVDRYKGKTYFKKGDHKFIPNWNYYFFPKDDKIGDNTFKFLFEVITDQKDTNNVILFFSGLNEYTYNDIISFYDKKPDSYHCNMIIVTKRNESFTLPKLKKIKENLIRTAEEDDDIDIYIHLIEVSSYCNQLGDEIGFPKNIVKEKLLEKDNELMIKHSFTFNIIVCGRPGAGKSTLINRILGKEKCLSAKGTSSLTQRVTKYISEKYPILIYDTPGFEKEEDVKRIQDLIANKNKALNEERNRIHCVFYVMNTKSERTFINKEYEFLVDLMNQKMDIFFIHTHSETKEKAEDYVEATKINLQQNGEKRIADLKSHIFPVELNDDKNYKRFGLKDVFTALYNKYKTEKIDQVITASNLKQIKSPFIGDITSKEKVKTKLTALSRRVKANFKLLASSLGNSPSVKTTSLSTSVIKIISKIYNHPITTEECLSYIKDKGYTDESRDTDTFERNVQKTFAWMFYTNGPGAKQVEYIAESLILEYNKELSNDNKFYDYLNDYNKSINYAIDCLNKIED